MDILTEAQQLVMGDRGDAYGDPAHKYRVMAKMWSAILNQEITPEQVVLCMLAVKLTRETIKHKRDNLVDLAGYSLVLDMLSRDNL
jgi:ribosomal protein L20